MWQWYQLSNSTNVWGHQLGEALNFQHCFSPSTVTEGKGELMGVKLHKIEAISNIFFFSQNFCCNLHNFAKFDFTRKF